MTREAYLKQLKSMKDTYIKVGETWSVRINSPVERREHEKWLRWGILTTTEKFADWAARHKLSFIVGSWAVAMTSAGAIIMRGPCVLCFPFVPCSRRGVRVRALIDHLLGLSSHSHLPVRPKGCEIT